MNLRFVALAAFPMASAVLLSACPNRSPAVCSGTLQACGESGCVDISSDSRNCGGCGAACQARQACVSGACQCKEGATLCSGQCAVTQSDARNCGACGEVCPVSQVCEQGQCRAACVLDSSTSCDSSCVDLRSDAFNCGGCGHECADSESCHSGHCRYDVVAACFSVGQVVGLQASSGHLGPAKQVGAGPQALGLFPDGVLVADGTQNQLRHARQPDFLQVEDALATSASPNHILVDRPYVYVVTSVANTLMVFREKASDVTAAASVSFLNETPLGANTSPQVAAKVGDTLYISLFGGMDATQGQKLLLVNVADPATPVVGPAIDLGGINLKSFDGGTTLPRPSGVALRGNALYVALSNLDSNFVAGGPGMLARIDLGSGSALSSIELPADQCLNPGWVAASADGATLYVSCGGKVVRDSNYAAVSSESAGIVALAADDSVRTTWSAACPSGVAHCAPPSPGRFARQGNRLFVADQTAGRVWILEDNGTSLVERRGHAGGGAPVAACGLSMGFGNITDIVAIP